MKIIIEFDKEEEFDKIFDTLADKIASDVSNSIRSKPYKASYSDYYGYKFKNVTFEKQSDAKNVLKGLRVALKNHGKVRVFDLYDAAGFVATKASDMNYGWTDLEGVNVVPEGDGWIIDFKQPKYIRYLYPKEIKH